MSSAIQNKLLNYGEVPPAEVWNDIARKLQEEFNPGDIYLSGKIMDAGIVPPPEVWNAIANGLTLPQTIQEPARVIPLTFRRIAAAVVVIIIAGAALLYFFNGTNNNAIISQKVTVVPENRQSLPESSEVPPPNTRIETNMEPEPVDASAPIATASGGQYKIRSRNVSRVELEHSDAMMPQAVNALQRIEVDAPPLRDDEGNIIMDLKLISSPDGSHIIVTSPSGAQTKISNKFLHYLTAMNNNVVSNNEDDRLSLIWQTRFQDWRDQLLEESAFIPSANNFFDILELKEMIREK